MVKTALTSTEIRLGIIDVLTEQSGAPASAVVDGALLKGDLGIGQAPIGNGEFLDLKEKLERRVGIRIPEHKLPSASQLDNLSVVDVINLFVSLAV